MNDGSMTRREFLLSMARGGAAALLFLGSAKLAGKVKPMRREKKSDHEPGYPDGTVCNSCYRCRSCTIVSCCLLPQGLSYKRLTGGR